MGLEVVLNEILARGTQEEQTLLRQAESEQQRILNHAEGEADEIRARAVAETRAKLEALRREQQSANESEVRRRILTAQADLAKDFRQRVLAALGKLPEKETQRLLSSLLKRAQKELSKGSIHGRKEDLAFLAKSGSYDKGNTIDTAGGFQVESPDGTVLLDYRFETLLDSAWKDILAETRSLLEG